VLENNRRNVGIVRDGENGNVAICVLPERQEIFAGGERPETGGIGIHSTGISRLQGIGTSHSQVRQRSRPAVPDNATMIENLLKLGGSSPTLSGC
jgi:hypothetical protein